MITSLLRVIAGDYKGRILKTPKGRSTRPTGDRVKEAIFSMIGPYFTQESCLDVFAGSGALGIEALSRGVQYATFIDKESVAIINENVSNLRLTDRVTIFRMNFKQAFMHLHEQGAMFDLVFADPPYSALLLSSCLDALVQLTLLAPQALVIAEMHSESATPDIPGLLCSKEAIYGITKIAVFRFA